MKDYRILALFAAGILTAVLAFAAVDNGTPSAPLTHKQILKQLRRGEHDGLVDRLLEAQPPLVMETPAEVKAAAGGAAGRFRRCRGERSGAHRRCPRCRRHRPVPCRCR